MDGCVVIVWATWCGMRLRIARDEAVDNHALYGEPAARARGPAGAGEHYGRLFPPKVRRSVIGDDDDEFESDPLVFEEGEEEEDLAHRGQQEPER